MREAVTRGDELLEILELQPEQVNYCASAAADFRIKVPRSFVARMRKGDPDDPLLRQVLAQQLELQETTGFTTDPVGECGNANPQAGVIHKYHGRALLIVTGACAVHCRYCFRRHFPYEDNSAGHSQWQQALDYLRGDTSISEVILSGGDPLVAGDVQLASLVGELAEVAHIRRLRIHSRVPVVLPERVTEALLQAITHPKLHTVMVVHSNHANEIDAGVIEAVAALRSYNVLTLNQAVLLAGINDNLASQLALSETLFGAGILPYYLHLLDRVVGAAHFEVEEQQAVALHRQMTTQLPGYLVPKLVREIEGAAAKVAIG
ncbi:MAG: EF-P beta-lysylation protein EpmB [Halioglobus sp.]